MSSELAQTKEQALAEARHISAMDLVSQAVANGAQVDQVDKLIELVKFNDQREALRAFNQAFTAAQAEFPEIPKTKQGHNSKYAPLDTEVRLLRPVLMKHGLSFRHEVSENDDKSVSVRCILAHEAGHCESATLTGPADTSGSKNSIQAIGSTVSYLRRYTLEAVTGIVTTDDDDGAAAGLGEAIDEKQAKELHDLLKQSGANKTKYLEYLRQTGKVRITSIEDIPARMFEDAKSALVSKVEAKKREAKGNE